MRNVIVLIMVMIVFSCKEKTRREKYWGEIAENILNGKDMKYVKNPNLITIDTEVEEFVRNEDIGNKVECKYIPIRSENIFGEIRHIVIRNEKIYITDPFYSNKAFVFDMQGNFLYNLGKMGQGPGEYISVSNMSWDEQEKGFLIKDMKMPHYYIYDPENGKIKKQNKSLIGTTAEVCKNKIVYYSSYGTYSKNGQENYQLVITDRNDSVLYKGFQCNPIQETDELKDYALKMNNDNLLFQPPISDTIYALYPDQGKYEPKYYIKHSKSVWKKYEEKISSSERRKKIKENGYTELSQRFFETDNFIHLSILQKIEGKNMIAQKPIFFDKKNRKIYTFDTDDMSERKKVYTFYQGFIKGVYGDYFVGEIPLDKLIFFRENIAKGYIEIKNTELLSLIKDETIESVITLFKFRNENL